MYAASRSIIEITQPLQLPLHWAFARLEGRSLPQALERGEGGAGLLGPASQPHVGLPLWRARLWLLHRVALSSPSYLFLL